VILPPDSVNRRLRSRHEEITNQIPNVVFLRKEHQKLIVIDRRLSFIGSMNVLAHPQGGRHEVMALLKGTWLAEQLLEHERIDELAQPPTCPKCHRRTTMAAVQSGRVGQGRLHWKCRTVAQNGERCNWTRPFADRPRTRNQARQ
jgi:phosphatidylserine/phosphatidylglycerophosphate/cardiolipin synthase-like enzyme